MTATHVLSPGFETALVSGVLKPILDAVQLDETLLIGIRAGYISIYYRGGELLKITEASGGSFTASFNYDYDAKDDTKDNLDKRLLRHGSADLRRRKLSAADDAEAVVNVFCELKRLMDSHGKIQSGHEREFQQLIARTNNRSRAANSSHYFITDIEHAKEKARFDMLGVRWRHNERKHSDRLIPVLFEVKYGQKAITGSASLNKHLQDALNYLVEPSNRETMRANIKSQFEQLSRLDLLKYNKTKGGAIESFTVVDNRFQIIFVIAEYPPHSTHLQSALDELDRLHAAFKPRFEDQNVRVELLFAGASLCGCAMYKGSMLSTSQLRKVLKAQGQKPQAAG